MGNGFKDKDGKFRPTEKQFASNVSSNEFTDKSTLRKSIPSYESPEYNELEKNVKNRMAHDFNEIRLENLQKVDENYYENIITTEPTDAELKDNGYDVKEMSESEIEDAKYELMDQQREIMWSTIFESKDNHLAEKIVENSDDLISKAGLTIIDNRHNNEGEYQTGVFIGINGAGYDFYQQHWIPMYKIFGWV